MAQAPTPCEGCGRIARRYKHGRHAPLCRSCLAARGEWQTQRRHWTPHEAVAALRALAERLDRTPGKRDWDKAREQHGLGSSDAVGRDGFGSWREFQRAAGLEPNLPNYKITTATAAGVAAGRNRQMVTGGAIFPDGR